MKKIYFLLTLFLVFFACKETKKTDTTAPSATESRQDSCELFSTAEVPPINRLTDRLAGERLFLRTDKKGRWLVEIYALSSCDLKAVYELPENTAPDATYFLANLNYNHNSRLVGIRSDRSFYVLDLGAGQLSEAIQPQFPADWPAEPESGRIQHLEVWEDYLVGATTDWGCFLFTLDSLGFVQIPPRASYQEKSGQYCSLFLIANDHGQYQAIIPSLSATDGSFSVRPIFPRPVALDTSKVIYAAGSPYVRLQQTDGNLIGIDLRTASLLPTIEKKAVE